MRVPSANYSPIEQANAARTNAIKAGYTAAQAKLWKNNQENQTQMMELNKKSLALGQKGLELDKWNNIVGTILDIGSQGLSFGERIYNQKLAKNQQEANAALNEISNEYLMGIAANGYKTEIVVNEDGTKTVVKPQGLIDLEKSLSEKLDSYDWMDELKPSIESGLNAIFQKGQLQMVQQAADADLQATIDLYNQNWNSAFSLDITAGGDVPENLFRLIDNRTDLSETQKQAEKAEGLNAYKTALQSDIAIGKVRSEGLSASISYIDSLDRTEAEKADMRATAYKANENNMREASQIGFSIVGNMMASENLLPSQIENAYEDIDEYYSSENGFSNEYRAEIKEAISQSHRQELMKAADGWIEDAKGSWDGLVNLYDSIDKGYLSGYFTNQEQAKGDVLSALEDYMSSIETLFGDSQENTAKSIAYDLQWRYEKGEISWNEFVGGIESLQRNGELGADSDMSKYFTDLLSKTYEKRNKTVDGVAKKAFDILKTNIGAKDIDNLDPEKRAKVLALEFDLYKSIGSWIDAYPDGADSDAFKENLEMYLASYDADYFDILDEDSSRITTFSPEGKKAKDIIKEVLSDDKAFFSLKGKSEAGMLELQSNDSNIKAQLNEAAAVIASKYNGQDKNLTLLPAAEVFEDKNGKRYLGFKDGDSTTSGYYFYDYEEDKLYSKSASPDSLIESSNSENTDLASMIKFKTLQGNQQALDMESIDWEAIADQYTMDELRKAIKEDETLHPYQFNIEKKVRSIKTRR